MSSTTITRRHATTLAFEDEDMDYYLMWALGYQSEHGSEVGECLRIASQIDENDAGSWATAWRGFANGLMAYGTKAEAQGLHVSAREAYLRAYTYYRTATVFIRITDARFRRTWRQAVDAFRKAISLLPQAIERVIVPFDQFQLPAYFYVGGRNRERRPTLIMTIGGEAFAEDSYFWCGAAGMRRGYNVLAADLLPHVGARFHNEEIPPEKMTAEWGIDRALEAVVDYALSRDDVQPEQLAIAGYSAGGTFAGRAVIRDRRLKALVADSPLYDLHELMAEEFPTVLQKVPRLLGNAFVKAVTSRNEKAAIVLERSAWQVGADNVFGLMEAARDLTFDPRDIPCPTLCLTGAAESEIFKRQAQKTYEVLDVPHKELHIFTAEEGADAHCQLNNLTLMQQVIFDWLDEVFATQAGSRGADTEDRGTAVPLSN